tara:strand:+ start:606 stop:803 length:198 start_codon:yes stop_codon:yes gene_type:complete
MNENKNNYIKINFKKKNVLMNSFGLKLAPCSYCNRKPGFYEKSINYCWFHWDEKNKKIVENQLKK